MEGVGAESASAASPVNKWIYDASRLSQYYLDKTTPLSVYRWIGTFALVVIYVLRVYYVQGFYIVSYGVGIYILNLLIGFLSPLADPEMGGGGSDGPLLPAKGSDEFKPFIRRLPEFKFWLSLQLPNAVKNSGFYFREISGFMFSPRFVFVVGNIIVIILFAESGKFSAKKSSTASSGGDFYDKFVQNSEKNQKIRRDEIEYKVNQSICDGGIVPAQTQNSLDMKNYTRSQSENLAQNHSSLELKNYSRSQSENLDCKICQNSRCTLRCSETEKFKKNVKPGEKRLPETVFPEDGMSNEEFPYKAEAFIARQQKFRLQEEYSVF